MHVNQLAIATCDVFHFFPMQGYLSVQTGEKVMVLYIGTTREEKHWTYARRIIPQYQEDYGWLHMNNIQPDNYVFGHEEYPTKVNNIRKCKLDRMDIRQDAC